MKRGRLPARAAWLVLGLLVGNAAAAFEDRTPRVHALVGARVVVAPNQVLEEATVVVRDGVVTAVGAVQPPADARLWDLEGRTIYAGLIEAYLDPESGKSRRERRGERGAETNAAAERGSAAAVAGVRHPNPKVRAEERVAEKLKLTADDLEALRAVGFAVAHAVPSAGVFRGQSAVVSLRPGAPDEQVLRADAAQIVAFERGSFDDPEYRRNPVYPGALMGAVALVRQTLLDARWARTAEQQYALSPAGVERPQSNLSFAALQAVLPPAAPMPVWLLTEDILGTLRCVALAREFELRGVLVGNGEEYRQLGAVRAADMPLVLPLEFPEAPLFADADEALEVELETLRHWNEAPANAARLHEAGVRFTLTSHGLAKRSDFRARVARAIEKGLPETAALAAVTTEPARLLGLQAQLGTIEPGKIASFTVTDGDLFAEKTRVLEVWVDGDRYEVRDDKLDDFDRVAGKWQVQAGPKDKPVQEWKLELLGNEWTLRGKLTDAAGNEIPLHRIVWQQGELLVQLDAAPDGEVLRLRPEKKGLRGTWSQKGKDTEVEAKRPEPSLGGER